MVDIKTFIYTGPPGVELPNPVLKLGGGEEGMTAGDDHLVTTENLW